MAQEEVMMAEAANEPMREAIARLEKQYEVDKKNALGIYSFKLYIYFKLTLF